MKKIISALMVSVMLLFCNCSVSETNTDTEPPAQANLIGMTERNTESYTKEDLTVLQDFLLCRRTTGNGKDFDLNHDGIWNIFDLCLLKQKLQPEKPEHTSDILVTYFSCTGTTEIIAEYTAEYLNADIWEIVPEVPYTESDLAYYTDCRADREQNDPSARPAISGTIENINNYETILIGYPIWHGQAPRIISTFLESYDFSDKTIIPFCTSHSSGIGSSDTNLHALTDDSVNWISGKRFSGSTEKEEVMQWADSLQLKEGNIVAEFDLASGENQKAPMVTLNSGYEMPIVGLGTYSLTDEVCVDSVVSALQQGFRMIDTAYMYHNEERVGEGIRQSGIPREDIFVITKLYPNQYDDAENAIDMALEKLGIDYIDMMLLHHPGENDVEAYHAMEQAVTDGKIHSIGLSNWYIEEMEAFLPKITIMPALVQNEIHPYYQEKKVINYMHNKGIVMQAWYPLGGRGYTSTLLGDETITKIAEIHHKSAAQVILRWDLQNGVVVIPGSSNPEHILENISIFDFTLTEEEMNSINALDRNEKHDWY